MVTGLEIGVLALVVVLVLGAARIIQAIRPLLINTVVGLVVFFLASQFGIEVAVNWITLLIVAIGGLPGALVVLLLAILDVTFVPGATTLAPP